MNQEKDEIANFLRLKIVVRAILAAKVGMPDRDCNYYIIVTIRLLYFILQIYLKVILS